MGVDPQMLLPVRTYPDSVLRKGRMNTTTSKASIISESTPSMARTSRCVLQKHKRPSEKCCYRASPNHLRCLPYMCPMSDGPRASYPNGLRRYGNHVNTSVLDSCLGCYTRVPSQPFTP